MRINPGRILRWLFPNVIWKMDDPDGIYLTFDDGPTPGVTEWILQTLDRYNAKATFFVLGKNVELYPDLYKMILDHGHKVGNHTYSHQKGLGMSIERYLEDVNLAGDLVHSELFRPPYAEVPNKFSRLSKRYNLGVLEFIADKFKFLSCIVSRNKSVILSNLFSVFCSNITIRNKPY